MLTHLHSLSYLHHLGGAVAGGEDPGAVGGGGPGRQPEGEGFSGKMYRMGTESVVDYVKVLA